MADDAFRMDARHRAAVCNQAPSADDLAREYRAQRLFFPALSQFQRLVRQSAGLSCLMADDFRALLDAMDDNAPTLLAWDEKIAEHRR